MKMNKESMGCILISCLLFLLILTLQLLGVDCPLFLPLHIILVFFFISSLITLTIDLEKQRDKYYYHFWSPICAGFLGTYFFIALTDPIKLPDITFFAFFLGVYTVINLFPLMGDKR